MVQVLVQGLATGMIYTLIGIGFVLVFRTVGLFNFAHVESYTLGALLTFVFVTQWQLPYWIAIVMIAVLGVLIGIVTERIGFRRLIVRDAPPVNVIVASIALGIILRALALLIWGPDAQPVQGVVSRFNIGPAVVGGQNVLIMAVALLMILGVWLLLYHTSLGVVLRAVADNRTMAGALGVDIRIMLPLAFGVAGLLGAIAGGLVAPLFFPQFRMGQAVLIKAFSASVIGGLDSIPGAIVGGLFIGLTEHLVGSYVTTAYKDVLMFALLILVLVVRPEGILGERGVEKV